MTMTTKVALTGLGMSGQRMPTHLRRHQNFGSAGGFAIGVVLIYVPMPNFCMTAAYLMLMASAEPPAPSRICKLYEIFKNNVEISQ